MKTRNTGVELERMADCITLLKRGPHAASEIAQQLGVRPASARRWCQTFEDKGHAQPTAKLVRGQAAKAWEWA